MGELFLTPTRRELLVAAHEQRVIDGYDDGHTWLVEAGYPNRKVDARVEEAQRARWLELPVGTPFWRLTDVGRAAMGWS